MGLPTDTHGYRKDTRKMVAGPNVTPWTSLGLSPRLILQQHAASECAKVPAQHPLLGFVDHGGMDHYGGGGEPVAELLRPGRAGSNTAADHVTVLNAALAQIPAALRVPDVDGRIKVWVRTDAPGRPRSSPRTCTARAWSSPWVPASLTSTSVLPWWCCRSVRGP
jgi:hypothetical protein